MAKTKTKTAKGRMYSISWLAGALQVDRGTLGNQLRVKGCESKPGAKNSKLYRLIDAIEVSLHLLGFATGDDSDNPDDWSPGKKKTYFEAKMKENQYRKEAGELVESYRGGSGPRRTIQNIRQ